ncbi:hypothetical protein K7432_015123 [Basidiobolus ranarum]|uniref:Uncharacterized protein n=1 Tax=Basidiobolus ranarum TaxID=34480 RepID=A0ABR2WGQ3_9FUNG
MVDPLFPARIWCASAGCIIGFCGLRKPKPEVKKPDTSKKGKDGKNTKVVYTGGKGQQGGGQWQQGGGQWQQGGGQGQQAGGQLQQGGGGGQGQQAAGQSQQSTSAGDQEWQYAEEGAELPPGASDVQYTS